MNEREARPCRVCGARIFFAKTAEGKTMPLNAKAETRFALEGDRCVARIVYETHWATCPGAKQIKEGKR